MSQEISTRGAVRTASRYAALGLGAVGAAGIALALSLYVWARYEHRVWTEVESYHMRSSSIASRLGSDIAALHGGLHEQGAAGMQPAALTEAIASARVGLRELESIEQTRGDREGGKILQAVVARLDRFTTLFEQEGREGGAHDLPALHLALDSLALATEQLQRLHAIRQTEQLALVASSSVRGDRVVALIAVLFATAVVAIGFRTRALLQRTFAREAELRASLEQARRSHERGIKMEALGRLAGGVAHDFNNLLTVMLANAEQIRGARGADSRLQREAESILSAVGQAAALTRQLLTFSRADPSDPSEPRAIDLNQLIRDMEILLTRLLGGHCTLIADLYPGVGPVRADPREIERILLNLVSNAGDAMPRGGTVTIETENVRRRRPAGARPGTDVDEQEHDVVRLSVYDTGIGMDEETAERVFEPFFTTKGEEEGTGLGLATVHGMVLKAGGWVEVESRVEIGTCIDVYLPRRHAAEPPEEPVREGPDRTQASETILLVEDEGDIRRSSALALRQAGYTVLESPDGPTALELCRSHGARIDLILTDVRMQGMTGPQLVERAKSVHPEARVLFMSGYAGADLPLGGRLLEKPFGSSQLLVEVRSSLSPPAGTGRPPTA